ncbi:MAG: tRNA dihydrouridine synthase DusB [Spirochaetales bacterium]|nr:tRNA dihydrouridine synthase DusB [Spirochaetales bacterium]
MADSLYRPVSIGKLNLAGNLFLAPLAGFTDRAFRGTAVSWDADLTYTEMISCEAVFRDNKKTLDMMEKDSREDIFAIQVFAGALEPAEKSVEKVLKYSPALIDLNCGCPVPKIIKSGAGSALMKDPSMVASLVKTLKTGHDTPVTVKIRTGWDAHSLNYREVAEAAVDAGAAAVAIHGRTRSQGYSGTADWAPLKELTETLPVPVFGSGDLFTPQDAKRMLEETGCAGLMFARGAIGNPFIFRQTRHLLQTGEEMAPLTAADRLNTALEQYRHSLTYLDELRASKEIRKHLCAYSKGIPGSSALRNELVHAEKAEVFEKLILDFLSRLS